MHNEEHVNQCDNRVIVKEKLTDSSTHFAVEVTGAVVVDEAGLTHS